MRIAIIGSGISGLSAAYLLDQKYDVTVYEAEDWIGGHTHTIPVKENNETIWIDTGFIVCNPKNYPNFLQLLKLLEVPLQKSDMSFSVSAASNGLEYNGTSLNGLFAQRSNLFSSKFLSMLSEISKFNAAAKKYIPTNNAELSIGKFIQDLKLSAYFQTYYLTPMISAIWSSDQRASVDMPALFICKFLENHGMLNINDRPQWYSIPNGSHTYVNAIVSKLKNKIKTNNKISKILRNKSGVELHTAHTQENFDKVIIATHSDQILKFLQQPTEAEIRILSAMRYQSNDVTLHTDTNLLPKNKRAWASWNYKLGHKSNDRLTVTYNMNMLQNLACEKTYCVSLNQNDLIQKDKIIAQFNYSHPIYNKNTISAQQMHAVISGLNNTFYCGAYWGSGFHEDGLNSALKVVQQLDKDILCTAPFSMVK